MAWYLEEGPEADVVVSTRVRLARNLANTPFPWRLSTGELEYVREKIESAFGQLCIEEDGKPLIVDLEQLGSIESLALAEKRIISRTMLGDRRGKALLLYPDEKAGLLVNEEDHLRIFAVSPGLALEDAAERALACAASLGSLLPFAKSERLGYLTACPTNTGTGMRASVMMHVPGLIRLGVIGKLSDKLAKSGYALRGAGGEGTSMEADLIQLSNQITLGISEKDILKELNRLVADVANEERKARRILYARDEKALEDEIGRARGQLMFAGLMTSGEALELLSLLRLGRELDLPQMPDYALIQQLMTGVGEGAIQQEAGRPMEARERDEMRAAMLNRRLLELSYK